MTDKQADLMLEQIRQFLKCFIIIGFDDDYETCFIGSSQNPIEEHAMRKLLEHAIGEDCLNDMFPSTFVDYDVGFEFDIDDEEGEEYE